LGRRGVTLYLPGGRRKRDAPVGRMAVILVSPANERPVSVARVEGIGRRSMLVKIETPKYNWVFHLF
jgi:hypothetical protein